MTLEEFKKKYPLKEYTNEWLDYEEYADFVKWAPVYFKDWFNKKQADYDFISRALAELFPQYFDIWWSPRRYAWGDDSCALAKYLSNKFDVWWDAEYFNWGECMDELVEYNAIKFAKWWPKDEGFKEEIKNHFMFGLF